MYEQVRHFFTVTQVVDSVAIRVQHFCAYLIYQIQIQIDLLRLMSDDKPCAQCLFPMGLPRVSEEALHQMQTSNISLLLS